MLDSRKGYREEDAPDELLPSPVCWFCVNHTHGDEDSVPFRPWARYLPAYRPHARAHRSCLRMVGFGPAPPWSPVREQGG